MYIYKNLYTFYIHILWEVPKLIARIHKTITLILVLEIWTFKNKK